ncbi:MAG: endolytic transglycosylase MltG [bacterium]
MEDGHKFSKYFIVVIGLLAVVSILLAFKLYSWTHPRIYRNPTVKVTLHEGLTNREMAQVLSSSLKNFDKDLFLNKTKSRQGYLFPDTYFFLNSTTAEDVVGVMHMNFNKRLKLLQGDIYNSHHSLADIITMASVIEKEASGKSDAPTISGILWKRLSIGMPLQVDIDKVTYKEKGLPSAPISNPGLVAIDAAIHPVDSAYLYYLHDKTGTVHYAENYDIHKKNIAKYLK